MKEVPRIGNKEIFFIDFESRVWQETDFLQIIQGILPKEDLFNPEIPIKQIETAIGPVEIIRRNKIKRFFRHLFSRILGSLEAAAEYSPSERVIYITPILNKQEALAAYANQGHDSIVGADLAHEALHAHQSPLRQKLNQLSAAQAMKEAVAMVKDDSSLTLVEAIQLQGRPRDLMIVTEVQAYVLSYMLRGPESPPKIVMQMIDTLKSADMADWQNVTINGVALGSIPENGQMSVVDCVLESVRRYLPKIDQDNEIYTQRIDAFCQQVIRALHLGLDHLQIANLIRVNYEKISSGADWDPINKAYRFLQKEIDELLEKRVVSDTWSLEAVDQFNKKTTSRLEKIAEIAQQSLSS